MTEFSITGNRLSWTDTNDGEYGYRIYRSDVPFGEILPAVYAELPPGSTGFLDTDVAPGSTNYYKVSSFFADKEIFAANTEIVVANHIPTNIGDEVFGGVYVGNITVTEGETDSIYAIIMALKDGETRTTWKNANTGTTGTLSEVDGMTNTLAMLAANSDVTPVVTHPAAEWCTEYTGGGFEDWYLPARQEMRLAYLNRDELASSGMQFVSSYYWTSTQHSSTANTAWFEHPVNGNQNNYNKTHSYYVRPVRRIKIQ